MDALRRLVRALRLSTAELERDFGLSTAQLFVLRQLAVHPGQSLTELAARTRTSPSSVSEVVARLSRRRLIERRAADADHRRAELTLTASGRAVLARAPVTIQERLVREFERLGSRERRALVEGLEAWFGAAGLAGIPAALFFEESTRKN